MLGVVLRNSYVGDSGVQYFFMFKFKFSSYGFWQGRIETWYYIE